MSHSVKSGIRSAMVIMLLLVMSLPGAILALVITVMNELSLAGL